MKRSTPFEPFLAHKAVAFNKYFTLIDTALNTSEIRPIHLSIPKNCAAATKNLAQVSQPTIQEKTPQPRSTQSRILSNAQLARTAKAAKERRHEGQASTTDSAPASPSKAQAIPRPAPPIGPVVGNNNEMLARLQEEDWMRPFASGNGGRFIFTVGHKNNASTFTLKTDDGKKVLLWASLFGSFRTDSIEIHTADRLIAQTYYHQDTGSVSCNFLENNKMYEVGCITNLTDGHPRNYNFIIPALKKKTETRAVPVETDGSSSILYQKLAHKDKEAIKLSAKIPEKKGDASFGGILASNSPTNFIIYHESNPKKAICTCDHMGGSTFTLCAGYPMLFIQAFFAAIMAAIPM